MKKVTCGDCGRSYDYDKDDFCPKCGSFNTPPDAGATALEAELLSRFDGGQRNQARAKGQQTQRQTAAAGKAPGAGGPGRLIREQTREQPREQTHYRYRSGPALDWEGSKRGKGFKPLLLLVVLAVVLAVGGICLSETSFPYGEPQVVGYSYDYALDGAMSVGPFQVELDGLREIRVPEESSLWKEGYALLAADVYITGGGAVSKKDAVGGVYLEFPGGETVPALDDILQVKRLKDLSEFAVDLGDALWEDPLMGSFVFYVPEDAGSAALVLEEAKGPADKGRVVVLHRVDLDLAEALRQ